MGWGEVRWGGGLHSALRVSLGFGAGRVEGGFAGGVWDQ